MNACVSSTAVEKVNSQTVSLPSFVPRANSITAERRQKRERWAKKPNSRPITPPTRVIVHISPRPVSRDSKDMLLCARQDRGTAGFPRPSHAMDSARLGPGAVHRSLLMRQ
jgi:hypothetical protein